MVSSCETSPSAFTIKDPTFNSRMRPLMFRVINQIQYPRLANSTFFQSVGLFVQHLVIEFYSSYEPLETILSSCPNIRNLAMHCLPSSSQTVKWNHILPTLQKMPHLTHLSVSFFSILSCDETPIQPFSNLTHLTIHGSVNYSWGDWEALIHLPKLDAHQYRLCYPISHSNAPPTLSPFETFDRGGSLLRE